MDGPTGSSIPSTRRSRKTVDPAIRLPRSRSRQRSDHHGATSGNASDPGAMLCKEPQSRRTTFLVYSSYKRCATNTASLFSHDVPMRNVQSPGSLISSSAEPSCNAATASSNGSVERTRVTCCVRPKQRESNSIVGIAILKRSLCKHADRLQTQAGYVGQDPPRVVLPRIL